MEIEFLQVFFFVSRSLLISHVNLNSENVLASKAERHRLREAD